MPTCALVSFRLGLTDGVSIVASSWADALASFGFDVVTVAGEGPVDRLVPGLAIGADDGRRSGADDLTARLTQELDAALADADLVVVENLCTIPLNLPAARAAAKVLAGRPAILHHHDPPWQRERFAHVTELPPDDPAWRHVTINRLTEREFAERGLAATTIYNGFAAGPTWGPATPVTATAPGRRLGVADDELLVAHPVRAIPRKDVPAAVRLCEQLDATYWLLGPAEEGYGARARAGAGRGPVPGDPPAAPPRSRPLRRARPGRLPEHVGGLRQPADRGRLRPSTGGGRALPGGRRAAGARVRLVRRGRPRADPGLAGRPRSAAREAMLDTNERVAREWFTLDRMAAGLRALLDEAGWLP